VHSVLLAWLAALFAVMAATLVLGAVVVGWPLLLLAIPMAAVAYLFWYHASGRLVQRFREEARNGSTATRGDWSPGGRRRRRATAAGGAGPRGEEARWVGGPGANRRGGRRRARAGTAGGRTPPQPAPGMSLERARGILDVDSGATSDTVRAAYRQKVKETHPDHGGSTDAFKRVNEAYETLGGDS